MPNVAFSGLSQSLCLARFSPAMHNTVPVLTSVSPIRFSFSVRLFIADVLLLKFVLQLVGDMGLAKGIIMSVALTVADS